MAALFGYTGQANDDSITYGPSTNICAPRGVVAYRTQADDPYLNDHVGRIVFKYFPGYGNFLGKVVRKVPERPVVEISYEDGDHEELYLDQLFDALMPLDTLPINREKPPDVNDKYGFIWPPPTTSTRLLVSNERKRKPSEYALRQEAMKLQKIRELEEAKEQKNRAREERERKRKEKAAAKEAHRLAREAVKQTKNDLEVQSKALASKRSKGKKPASSTRKQNKATKKSVGAGRATATAAPNGNKVKLSKGFKSNTSEAKAGAAVKPDANLKSSMLPKKGAKSKDLAGGVNKKARVERRRWIKCDQCPAKHWSDVPCPACYEEELKVTESSPSRNIKRWSGNSTAALLVALREQVQIQQDSSNGSTSGSDPSNSESDSSTTNPLGLLLAAAETQPSSALVKQNEVQMRSQKGGIEIDESKDLDHIYQTINGKIDITSGADGYGMTGNVTRASMHKLFEVLRNQFELGKDSWFMDLGHGMGRPTMHAAALKPGIAGSFGTEFNPQLYKQSMLTLVECAELITHLKESPRVFFMDQNIKGITSLVPFTHVYTFQIGMPEDVVDHILRLIATSHSVKYAILYPHRAVTSKKLSELGEVVHTQSMSMPGGRSYEVNVVKIHHKSGDGNSKADVDVQHGLEVLQDKQLYEKYLEQIGIVTMLENEQVRIMQSRASRRNAMNTRFLEQSPCLPDINYGFLRRIAVALGVSTTGGKVQILSNIQVYCPVTFGLSMFAVGDNYTEEAAQKVVDKLLAVPPSRRQPEALAT